MAAADVKAHPNPATNVYAARMAAMAKQGVHFAVCNLTTRGYSRTIAEDAGGDADAIYKELTAGNGASPKATDTVKVNYRGTFTNNTEFDSSYKRNQPAQFPLNGVIKCWTEGVQRMKVGGKATLYCPATIAYGAKGAGGVIPPNTPLQFEVELLEIVH